MIDFLGGLTVALVTTFHCTIVLLASAFPLGPILVLDNMLLQPAKSVFEILGFLCRPRAAGHCSV